MNLSLPARAGSLLTVLLLASTLSAQVDVHIQLDRPSGPVRNRLGFTHGFPKAGTPPGSVLDEVRPGTWRLGHLESVKSIRNTGATVIFVLSDTWLWLAQSGQIPSANPAQDWSLWETYVRQQAISSRFGNAPVDFWDVWNEPDHRAFWDIDENGDGELDRWGYATLLELYRRTRDALRSIIPSAKILGPSYANFETRSRVWKPQASSLHRNVIEFVQDLDRMQGMRLDAIAWHENEGQPHGIPFHAKRLRWALRNLDVAYQPEIIISEFSTPALHLAPAIQATYLQQFEKADVDRVTLACWTVWKNCLFVPSPLDTCWDNSLNGLFLDDGQTPLAAYWFWKWHAAETGARIPSWSQDIGTFALASLDPVSGRVRVALARHSGGGGALPVRLRFEGYGFAGSTFDVTASVLEDRSEWCNRWNGPVAVAVPEGPSPLPDRSIAITAGKANLLLTSVKDLSVTFLELVPR